MLTRAGAQALAEYKTWADGLTLAAVAGLPPGEAARERATPHKSLIGTLNHMYVVDLIWEAHLGARAHGFTARNVIVHPDIGALAAAGGFVASLLHQVPLKAPSTDWNVFRQQRPAAPADR